MSKSYKINGELIKSSGEKLKMVGHLMIGTIGIYLLLFLIISISSNLDFIALVGVFSALISIGGSFLIIKNIIECGSGFIESVEITYEDGVYEEYYSDGKLKEMGTKLNSKKHGVFENYFESGLLKSKGTYLNDLKNGDWKFYFSDMDMDNNQSGYYENGEKVRPLK